jgi:hypothetical protein
VQGSRKTQQEQREDNHIPADVPILFLEIDVEDPSESEDVLEVRGVNVSGHKVLRAVSSVVPNAIAALLLHLRVLRGGRRTATSAGPRAIPSCTCCGFFSLARATQPP